MLLTLGGCGSESATPVSSCPAIGIAAVDVFVVDSVAPDRILPTFQVRVVDFGYRDSVRVTPGRGGRAGPFGFAHERAGNYTVDVTAANYRPWIREGIRVTSGICHPETVELTARLQPL
jgi:hypothetical protein